MKDHVKDPSVFDICPISTNNSSDATHYKRRTQYQQNNVWIAIQICLALYTYNLNINHQWFFYTCVTICNMDLYIIKKGAGSSAYVMLWKRSLIDDIFYISFNSLVVSFYFLSTFLIIQVIRWFPLIFLSESCEQQLLTNLKKKKMEKKMNHTHKSLVMSYGSYTKDKSCRGVRC